MSAVLEDQWTEEVSRMSVFWRLESVTAGKIEIASEWRKMVMGNFVEILTSIISSLLEPSSCEKLGKFKLDVSEVMYLSGVTYVSISSVIVIPVLFAVASVFVTPAGL